MELTLRVVDSLEDGAAQQALLKMALEKAMERKDEKFCSSEVAGLLWKWAMKCADKTTFDALKNKLKQADASTLQPTIETLLNTLVTGDRAGEMSSLLQTARSSRIKWLKEQIQELSKPFTWEMPDAKLYSNRDVETFLRGPEESMTVEFDTIEDARDYAEAWENRMNNSSFKTEAASSGENAFITITKTREWFDDRQKTLEQYKEELTRMVQQFGERGDDGDERME